MKRKWLITGGCGFIGTSLVKKLLELEVEFVRIVDNLSVGTRADLAKVCKFTEHSPLAPETWGKTTSANPVELIPGDILDGQLALNLTKGMDVIVHLAANTGVAPSVADPMADCMHNVVGTLHYLEAARHAGCKHFVFASSGAVVGECIPPLHENLPSRPVSPYGASKMSGEAYCSAYHGSFGINTVALRFSNVYGPLSSHKNSLVARCIRRVMKGDHIEIFGDGTNTRDFLYIEDLVNAILLSAKKEDVGGEAFQIATNEETSVNDLVEKLMPVLHNAGYADIKVIYEDKRTGDVMRNFADTSKARTMLGWQPQTSLQEGLEKTMAYFMTNHQQ